MVRPAGLFRACYWRIAVELIPSMAISRFRDRSGLVTRNRVIAYLEREKRNKHKPPVAPVTPVEPNTSDYRTFYMSGLMGGAPNREADPETSLRPVFFMTGLMGVAPNRTVNSVI